MSSVYVPVSYPSLDGEKAHNSNFGTAKNSLLKK